MPSTPATPPLAPLVPRLTVGQLLRREAWRYDKDLFHQRSMEVELLGTIASRLAHMACPDTGAQLKTVLSATFASVTGRHLPEVPQLAAKVAIKVEGGAATGGSVGSAFSQATAIDAVALRWHFEELALSLEHDRRTMPPSNELVFADLLVQPTDTLGLTWRERADGTLWQRVAEAATRVPFPSDPASIRPTLRALCAIFLGRELPTDPAAKPISFWPASVSPLFWLEEAPAKLEARYAALKAACEPVDSRRRELSQDELVASDAALAGPPQLPRPAVAVSSGVGGQPGSCMWIAFGDHGDSPDDISVLSDGIVHYLNAQSFSSPGAILVLGDNFYPEGVPFPNHVDFWRRWALPFVFAHPTIFSDVPFKVIIGNHDRGGDADAQCSYTTSPMNPGYRWQMCGDDGKPDMCYSFVMPMAPMVPSGPPAGTVHFFAFDTCAAQREIRRKVPGLLDSFNEQKERLQKEMKASTATWKIIMGHHPLYTNGLGHQSESLCMRLAEYTVPKPPATFAGFAMEDVLVDCGIDAYFAGHEHVLMHHKARGVLHVGCGGSTSSAYYQGTMPARITDWDAFGPMGFVATTVTVDPAAKTTSLQVQFIVNGGELMLEEVVLTKPWAPPPAAQ